MKLAPLLEIAPGVTAVIGGGGKTALLRVLGEELSRGGSRVLLCTTTKILPFPGIPLAADLAELTALERRCRLLCCGVPVPGGEKLTVPDIPMGELAVRFDYVLVEADGSARRPLKAHAPHEPVVPPEANQVILTAGASGFGRPIREAAHRPERYADLAGVAPEEAASPETEAAVLLAEALHHRIFINQAESGERQAAARRLAGMLDGCPVLAGSLREREYRTC